MRKFLLTNISFFYTKKYIKIFSVSVLAIIAFILLGNFLKSSYIGHSADTAFLIELTDKTIKLGQPDSEILRTTSDAVKTWTFGFDQFKQKINTAGSLAPYDQPFNILDYHAYYGIYAISSLSNFFAPELILSYLHSFSFIILLLLSYLFLRSQQVSVGASLLFCLVIALHPAWAYSANGQFYIDRFYMPFALIYLLGIHSICLNHYGLLKKPVFIGLVLLSGIFAASFTERAAIMVGYSSFAVLFINWQSISSYKVRWSLGVFGILFILYVYLYYLYRFDPYYQPGIKYEMLRIQDIFSTVLNNFTDNRYQKMYFSFFTINIGMLGFFAFFAGIRVVIVAMACLLPNVLITVGGAELTGWTSHYHAMYIPFLIFTALLGYKALSCSNFWHKHTIFQGSIKLLPVAVIMLINPFTGNINLPTAENFIGKIKSHMQYNIIYTTWNFYLSPSSSHESVFGLYAARLVSAIPENKKVTTFEGVMPPLAKGRKIFYYPIGIDTADYAVLNHAHDVYGNLYYQGANSFTLETKEKEEVDRHLTKRLELMGYNINQPLFVNGLVVIARNDLNELIYGEELITNSKFLEGLNSWNVSDVNKSIAINNNVEVNVNDFISQTIEVNENTIYKYSIKARCDSENTYFRMQINWLDINGKLILYDNFPRMCKKNMNIFVADFMAPPKAHLATLTLQGANEKKVVVSSVSFKKRLKN